MSYNCTVISHFYNEEYLLPWWLEHHGKLFSHGILINRGSTDRSVEICRRLVPNWELRDARVTVFDAAENEKEVMEIETKVSGWKIVLNTTEFLCCRDIQGYLKTLEELGQMLYRLPAFAIIDDPNVPYIDPNPAIPLVNQRHHGYRDKIHHARFIHKHPHGAYGVGRHFTDHKEVPAPSGAVIKWFVFSPWNDAMRKRKLQIQHTIPESDRALSRGIHHFTDGPGLERSYLQNVLKAVDLRLFHEYLTVFPEEGFHFINRINSRQNKEKKLVNHHENQEW